jgi:O-antigen/teichoic acid export membrane protein
VVVPASILQDVRVLFSFLFVNFIISITLASYGVVTFALNKLYLKSMRSIESNLIRVVSVVILFRYFPPKISFLGFTAFIALMYVEFFNIYYTRRFLPKVRLSRSFFDRTAVLELMSSGVWNTVIRLGNLLLSGMDLIIANRLIGPSAMGILALAKMVPNHITTMVVTISAVFTPEFTIYYAQGRKKELVVALKRSMKILGIIANMPIAILVAYGYQFFSLWVPGQDARLLQILSVITVGAMVISGPINSIYGIFTVTNRLRVNALLLVFSGLLNIVVVIFLVQNTNWGLFAVAGVSTVLNLLRNLLFTAPFGARYLDLPWNTFFPEIARGILAFLVVIVIGLGMEQLIPGTNWSGLVLSVAATAGLGLVANAFLMLTRSERDYLVRKIASSVSSRAFRSK